MVFLFFAPRVVAVIPHEELEREDNGAVDI